MLTCVGTQCFDFVQTKTASFASKQFNQKNHSASFCEKRRCKGISFSSIKIIYRAYLIDWVVKHIFWYINKGRGVVGTASFMNMHFRGEAISGVWPYGHTPLLLNEALGTYMCIWSTPSVLKRCRVKCRGCLGVKKYYSSSLFWKRPEFKHEIVGFYPISFFA